MPDIFSTDALVGVVQDLRVPQTGLASAYFGSISQDDSEEIHFDVENKPRRMAPFVSPLVAGKVVQSRGHQSKTFRPAYVKDKRTYTPTRALKRAMGERIGGGELSPEQRMTMLVVQDLQDQLEMIERRMEWMAAKILYAGSVTIVGDEYPATLVDFGRDPSLTVALAPAVRWNQAGVNPLDDLQDWSDSMVLKTGTALTEVTMTVDVWKIFRKNPFVEGRLDVRRGTTTIDQDAHQTEGRAFRGVIDGFAIWTYSGWAIDPLTGTEDPLLPAGTVIGTPSPSLVEGVRHYGAIMDHDVLRAMPYYPKSWLNPDPSVRFLLLQSAPLLVPYRVNATFRATVL